MKIFKFWFPLVVYSGIIFLVSSLPGLKPPVEGFNIDKILHMGEYIPFGFLAARAFRAHNNDVAAHKLIILAVSAACFYGISDEYHQSFVDGRFASVFDVMADTAGGFIGAFMFVKLNKFKGKIH